MTHKISNRACAKKRIGRVLISSTFVLGVSHKFHWSCDKERGAEQVPTLVVCVVLWAHARMNSDEIRPKAHWKAQHGPHWHENRESISSKDKCQNVEDKMA